MHELLLLLSLSLLLPHERLCVSFRSYRQIQSTVLTNLSIHLLYIYVRLRIYIYVNLYTRKTQGGMKFNWWFLCWCVVGWTNFSATPHRYNRSSLCLEIIFWIRDSLSFGCTRVIVYFLSLSLSLWSLILDTRSFLNTHPFSFCLLGQCTSIYQFFIRWPSTIWIMIWIMFTYNIEPRKNNVKRLVLQFFFFFFAVCIIWNWFCGYMLYLPHHFCRHHVQYIFLLQIIKICRNLSWNTSDSR